MRTIIIVMFKLLVCLEGLAQHNSQQELSALNTLIGDWKVKAEMRLSKNGPWETSEARSRIKKVIGETIFEEEFAGTKQGRVLTAKSWLGNDNRTKLYQRIWVDSDHGVLMVQEGKMEKKVLTLSSDIEINAQKVVLKVVYNLVNDNMFTVESARSTDEGKTWDRTGTLTYTRIR